MIQKYIRHPCRYKTLASAQAAAASYRQKAKRFARQRDEMAARAFALWAADPRDREMEALAHRACMTGHKAEYALIQAKMCDNICNQFLSGQRKEE